MRLLTDPEMEVTLPFRLWRGLQWCENQSPEIWRPQLSCPVAWLGITQCFHLLRIILWSELRALTAAGVTGVKEMNLWLCNLSAYLTICILYNHEGTASEMCWLSKSGHFWCGNKFPYRGNVWLQVVSWINGLEVSLLTSLSSIWVNSLTPQPNFFAALYCISFTSVQSKCLLVAGTLILWMCSLLGPRSCCFIPSNILLSFVLLWLQCLFQRVIEF